MNEIFRPHMNIHSTNNEQQTDSQIFKMRVKVRSMENLNTVSTSEIFLDTKQDCAHTENQRERKELVMDEAAKELIARYSPKIQSDNNNDDDMPIILNIEQSKNTVSQSYENESEEIHVFAEIGKIQDKTQVTTDKPAIISNVNKKILRACRKSNRLQANCKKECLKKTSNSGKVMKQKVIKKSDKTIPSSVSDEVAITLGKQFETKEYYKKSTLPAFTVAFSNNTMHQENVSSCYGVTKQQDMQHYGLDNKRSSLQYLDYNMRYTTSPEISLQSNSWLMPLKSAQNSVLNNIEMKQHGMRQSFINEKQSYTYAAVDYNRKQYENPYLQSSINPVYPYKIYPMRSGDYYCYNNRCSHQNVYSNTNNPWSNMYTGADVFPKTNTTFPQTASNIMSNHVSSSAISNNLSNTAIGASVSPYNYQLGTQPGHEYKRLFHRNLNTINYANTSGYEMMSIPKENAISPFNNWHHVNHSFTPYNSNVNIPSASITSDVSLSGSLYTDNANAHFNNHYNNDLVKVNVYADQHKQVNQCNEKRLLQTASTFKDSIAAVDTYKINSDGSNTLQHQNSLALSTDSGIMSDITNFLPETMIEYEKCSPSTSNLSPKKEDWISYVFDTVYKDIL